MRLTAGSRVGPYEVVALLGVGGMAEVYRARDTRLGRDVALKIVSELIGADGPMLERFEREARLASSLSHPNVVALYDVGFDEGQPYLVTELLKGESLRERLARGPVPSATALAWAAQMAQGLSAAHERGIVHRDLKPENVFITRDGHLKLIDFGIAKLTNATQQSRELMENTLSPSGSNTGTGMVLGTPGYMSPEQVEGRPVDSRTDFFSLGAVLYEMLCGRRAIPKGSLVEAGYATLHSEPDPLPPTVSPAVVQAVRRCLEKEPGRRFQSARDLVFHLEQLQTATGSSLVTASFSMKQLLMRWRWPLAGGLAALALATSTYFIIHARQPALPAVEQITFRLGTVSAARFSPEGRVIYSAAWGGQPVEIFTQTQRSPNAQSSGLRGVQLLGVSANGDLAVSVRTSWWGPTRRGVLAIVPSVGGGPREVAEDIPFADWSPSGELAVVRVVGGKRRLEYPMGTVVYESPDSIFNPRVSPHGDWIAFLLDRDGPPTQLFVVDRQGKVRTSFEADGASGLAWAPSGDEVWISMGSALWASSLSGEIRRVYQGVDEMRLEDIARGGAVLVNARTARREIAFVPPGENRSRGLSWLNWNHLGALSDDGSKVLFSATPHGGYYTYVRPTDGSPPVELGRGFGLAFSPDGKSVLAQLSDNPPKLQVLPLGPGIARTLNLNGVEPMTPRWLRDGKRIVFVGRSPDHEQFHFYVVPTSGGVPTQLSDSGVRCCYFEVSQDDRLVAARNLDDVLTLYPVDGSAPTPLPELGKDSVAVAWDPQGDLWVRTWRERPTVLRRYDLRNRRVLEERTVAPDDTTGLVAVGQICITPDGRSLAFDYIRVLGGLYQLDGLAPRGSEHASR